MKIILFNKEITLTRRKAAVIILAPIAAIILGVFGYIRTHDGEKVIIGKSSRETAETVSKMSSAPQEGTQLTEKELIKKEAVEEIKVYVVGCVKNQGIVTLKKGQIVNDAVIKAGGLTKDADSENINLAYTLNENSMIKIKSKKETQLEKQKTKQSAKPTPKPATPVINTAEGTGIELISGSGEGNDSRTKAEGKKSGKININTATKEELDTLPRIGQKTADDIIAYRQKLGGYKKIEDIMEVPRIGEKTFENLKGLIEVN